MTTSDLPTAATPGLSATPPTAMSAAESAAAAERLHADARVDAPAAQTAQPAPTVEADAQPAQGGAARPPRKRRRGGRNRGPGEGSTREAGHPVTQASTEIAAGSDRGAARNERAGSAGGRRPERQVHPLLEKLAALYPQLFGARFLPLQRGVYEELLARHPEALPQAELKIALGLHARSARYLEAIAARHPRHNLEGEVVEAVAPEHVHHAIVELFRRRQSRTQDDLRPQLIARLVEAIDASGLDRESYTQQVRVAQPQALALLDEAFAERGQRAAKREALLRAFEASGQPSVEAFAEMYGMNIGETKRLLAQARSA